MAPGLLHIPDRAPVEKAQGILRDGFGGVEGILYCRQGGRAVAGAVGVGQVAKEEVPTVALPRGTVGSVHLPFLFHL